MHIFLLWRYINALMQNTLIQSPTVKWVTHDSIQLPVIAFELFFPYHFHDKSSIPMLNPMTAFIHPFVIMAMYNGIQCIVHYAHTCVRYVFMDCHMVKR